MREKVEAEEDRRPTRDKEYNTSVSCLEISASNSGRKIDSPMKQRNCHGLGGCCVWHNQAELDNGPMESCTKRRVSRRATSERWWSEERLLLLSRPDGGCLLRRPFVT